MTCFFALKLEIVVTRTDLYRQAIKRTFANLYGVSTETVVDVSWTTGKIIVVQCTGKTFLVRSTADTRESFPSLFLTLHLRMHKPVAWTP
jgi:hypothetical protein